MFESGVRTGQTGKKYVWPSDMITSTGGMPVLVKIECWYLKLVFGLFRQCEQNTMFESGICAGHMGKKSIQTSDMMTGTRGMLV
jgi:hypothetical protein